MSVSDLPQDMEKICCGVQLKIPDCQISGEKCSTAVAANMNHREWNLRPLAKRCVGDQNHGISQETAWLDRSE